MIRANLLHFDRDDVPDAARRLFSAANSLNIAIVRPSSADKPFLMFELVGSFDDSDGDVTQLATELLRQFGSLGTLKGGHDERDA